MEELRLPELGENVEEVEVVAVLVAVGEVVRRDQPVIEVETEKASLEVPAECDGEVKELLVKTGDKIRVNQIIARLETAVGKQPAASATSSAAKAAPPVATPGRSVETAPSAAAEKREVPSVITFPAAPEPPRGIGQTVPAAPSVRALARELGIDIHRVSGSGPGGRISRDDVKTFTKSVVQGSAVGAATTAGAAPPLPDFSRWGEVEHQPLTNVRRATASSMAHAWSTVPHVTQFDHSDITQLESMRKRFNKRPEMAERKLTMTAIVVKMVASALKQFPKFNASLDVSGNAVVLKKYVHIGVAVDTARGLLVPAIRHVDQKSVVQVAGELNDLATRARSKKLKPDEMQGAGFTVSNLGGLGTTYFSPIVNWPEVAILGVGRAANQAILDSGSFRPRLIMPLSLSYDHRLIDGADAARFLRWFAEALEQPLLLLLDE